jgi:hypothetical protein
MKIYDCFIFRNELDLLEIRLKELYDQIDYFVVVESTHTFQGQSKPLVLKDNWDRYSAWHGKIIHIIVDDMPNRGNAWENEHHQRNAILRGLNNADDEDVVIISDVDELLRSSVVADMRLNPRDVYGFRIPYFNFRFNYMLVDNAESYHVWNTAGRKKLLTNPEQFRNQRFGLNRLVYEHDDGKVKIYEHAGWHFTYLGDTEWIKDKLKSFAHTELNRQDILDKIDVDKMMSEGVGFNPLDPRSFVKIELDDYFPATITDNQEKYNSYIAQGALQSVKDFI